MQFFIYSQQGALHGTKIMDQGITNTSYAWMPIIIAVIALLVSAYSIWRSHMAPFRLKVTTGAITIRLYDISSDTGYWWIASVHLHVSFTNTGANPGKIYYVRLTFDDKSVTENGRNRELFEPVWNVHYPKYYQLAADRGRWLTEAIESDWCPFILLPKDTISKDIILERCWDELNSKDLIISFDVFSDHKLKWITYQTYKFHITEDMIEAMLLGTAYTTFDPFTQNIQRI